jgi:nucleoside-diphosphate-sugar epimerase
MITILGSSGFIGSFLAEKLRKAGHEVSTPARDFDLTANLGNVIYCIGLTADFRYRPFDTVEAHVCLLKQVLEKGNFESLTYLSSTRVYINSKEKSVNEDSSILVNVSNPDDLYTLTKLAGESLCINSGRNAKIVRISNVVGSDISSENFISLIVREIQSTGHLTLYSSGTSAKDYISIDVLCEMLLNVTLFGKNKIYNLAAGENITNEFILAQLRKYYAFTFDFASDAREVIFPAINIDRYRAEFNFDQTSNQDLLFQIFKTNKNDTN